MIIIFLILFFACGLEAWGPTEVTYSRACVAGQCGDWQRAQQQMSNLVIDNPDRAELLYDNGVAAFRLQEFQKAGAYFEDVIKKGDASVPLKKQAHFNLGNTKVALNELPKAIEQYEAVLAIDPHDERAKYNLEKVRALLAQQQQEQKKEEQQKNQEQNQDGDSDSEQKSSEQQEGNQDQDKQQNQGNDSSEKKQSGNKKQESSQGDGQGDKSQDSSKQKDDSASKSDQQRDKKDQTDSGSAGQDQNQEQDQLGDGHDNSPEGDQKKQTDDADNVASQKDKKQDSGKQKEDQECGKAISSADDTELDKDRRAQELSDAQKKFAPNEQWMARLLQRQDKADERANKRLIKATVDKNMAGKYGQNNW